jgi:hypothetical protein
LFERLHSAAFGAPFDQVTEAGLNLVINAVCQAYATRDEAERAWEVIATRVKSGLADCYDAGGRKKSHPYRHIIE